MTKAQLAERKQKLIEQFSQRKVAYSQTFGSNGANVKVVLGDLSFFCRADRSCFHMDPRAHAVLEGRREVYLRIMDHINLSPEEFLLKYAGTTGEME